MSQAKDNNSNQTLAILAFVVLAALLIAVFLSTRGADVGKLPQLIGNGFNGKLFSPSGFGESLLGFLIAVLIATAWFGLGSFLVGFFEKNSESNALSFARRSAFGAAAWSLGLYWSACSAVIKTTRRSDF